MGKKESLNPFDYRDGGQPLSSNPFEARNQLSNIEVASQSMGLDAKYKAEQQLDAELNAIMDKIPELNKQERDYLMKVGKSGQLTKQEIQSAIDVMRGADAKQQQYISTSGEIKQLKSPSELAKEQAAKGGMSTLEMVNEGVDNLFAQTGKLLGRGQYYMKDNGRGIKVPVALAIGERPEAGHTVDSIWGSEYDAEDDSRGTDIAKKIVNLIPQTIQGILSLPELAEGLAAGETGTSFKTAKNLLESAQFKTADKYNESVVDTSKIKKFSDVFDADVYDMSSDKLLNTAVNAGTSILQLFLTRGTLGFTKATGGIAKTGNVMASFTTNLAEPLKAADDAGVKDRDKYLVALAYSSVATGLELGMGIEGKILNSAGKSAQKSFVKNLIKDNIEVVGGKVTKESLDKLYTETVKKLPSFWARNTKNVVSEASEEVLQNMAQNGIQQIHDEIVKDNPDEAKYNSKFWSPESLGDYINSAISGAIGGAGGSFFTKSDKQSKITYDAVSNEKETELKADLASSLNRGKITQDEYDRAIFKIDAYKEYFEATKDKPIDDESKRKIFDLTYQKQNIKSAIETLKEKNPNGINDPFIAQKEAELKDITNQVNEIWTKANPSSNPVAQAKADIPAWRVSLNDFTTEIKNPDKTVSQKLKTRKDILDNTGINTSLNKLAKAFNIEFKTPRVPEESGPIQVKDGILYEPYMTEKTETKDSELKTRGLPVFAFEDKDGGTWLFAAGEQTKADIPDTSYLIKLNEDGSYEGHEEFHYETPKMNMLSFDDIPQAFTRLGLQPVATSNEVRGYKGPVTTVAAEEIEEEEETEVGPDETLYNEVFADVKAGKNRGKLTALPNNTFGVIVNGRTIPFASSAAENSYTFKENFPDGDVEVGIEARENIPGYEGTGLMVMNLETGAEIGYLRATEKSSGKRKKVNTEYDVEQSVEIPTTLTDKGQEVLDKLKADSDNYQLIEDENGRRYVDKSGKEYKSVSSYLSGTKSGGNFKGDQKLKEAAFKVGRTIDAIVDDFFNGTIKPYSEYSKIMSKDDYNDVVKQLDKARKFATDNGFSIITEPIVLADEKQGVAGSPNIIMVDKDGGVYIYDTATIRNPKQYGRSLAEHFEKFPNTRDRISNQVNLLADILKSKHGIEAKRVGFVPFEVDYTFKGGNVKITSVKQNKRYDIAREVSEPKVEVKQGPKQPLTTEEVTQYMQGEDVKFEQGMKENEFEKAILDKSENPAQIAAAYLTAEVSDVKAGESLDVMDAIYTFFKNGNKLSKEAFDRISDPNFRNKLDLSGLNSYVATKGGGENLDSSLLTDNNEDVTPEKVAEFISSYPKGFTQYEKVFTENNLKNKLAAKFKQLTGKTLTEKIANQLAEAMYGVQMEEETKVNEAEEIAKAANEAAKKAFMPESEGGLQGKDIIGGDENDVAFQKKKGDIDGGEAAYEKWKGDNTEYEGAGIQEVKTGEPVMLTVYHGTTNEFYEFDASVKGNVEGHLGKVNYFTSDRMDAQSNYLSEGADLTGRIDSRQERIESVLEDDYTDEDGNLILSKVKEDFGITTKELKNIYPSGIPKDIKPNEVSRLIAEKELKGKEERVLKLHVKLNNPVVLGKKSTWIEAIPESEYEGSMEDAANEIAEENDITPEEAMSDYDFDVRQRAIELSGAENVVQEALSKALDDNGYDSYKANEILGDFYDSEIDLNELEKSIRKADLYENYEGEMASAQVIADMFKNLGYDGIILTDVSSRFKNMGLGGATSHIHVFDDYANQIKLADGTNKTFNPDTKDIRYQRQKKVAQKANVETIVETLKKAMPNVKVVYDETMDAAGKWNRATKTITINPYYAGLDTPIHEYGHVLIDAMGDNRVVKAAIKQLKNSDLWKETKRRYPELSEEQLGIEVLAEAIGREGEGIFDDQANKSKLRQYLEYIYDWFKTQLGLNKNVAKSLAKKIIGGIGTKKMEGKGVGEEFQKVKKKPMLDEESYYRIAYGEKRGITLDNLRESVDRYKAMADADPNDKTAARKYEDAKNKVEEFDRAYKKYRYDYNKLNKLKEEKGNLDGKSFDELVEIYNIAAEFDQWGDNSFLNDVKYRIAYLMAEEQRKFLESKGHSVKPKAFNDIKGKDVFMKSLAHMTEAFPEMQYLSKAYDAAVREMNMERREKQMKLDALAKSVAKEESKTLGLKMKDFLTGKAYEFFKWMDKNGELISTDEAYKLSKAKGDYVKFYREIREEYKDLQENTPAGYDENALLMTDKNFSEKLSSNGIVSAIQSWLGTNSGMRNVVMNYTHSDKRTEPLTLAEIEVALQNEANKGLISAAVAAVKSIYYNTKAKKLINKGVDEEGNDISHLKNQGDYMLDKKGKLVNKFGTKRPDGYDYSKDFHAAMVQYLADMTWTKHMQPLIPMVESVEQYSKATGATKGSSKNLAKWIESWKKMHIYKERPDSKFPELDMTLKFLRKMTSWTKLAFNLKASVMNLAIGEYNNWKEVGGKDGLFLKGHTRLLATTPSGKKKFSNKAYNFLTKNGFVATDYDEMPTARAGQLFTYLGMGSTKAAEYVIQGSLALGQIPNNIWKDINSEGEYVGSDPNIKEKIEQWRTKVSDIHGKYSAKDRRNFELYEFGKFVGQFKTWIPDWWKERFGDEYIDQYGKRHKGTYRGLTLSAINELRKDIVKPEFWTSDKVEYVNARKNLKAALVFGTLLAFQAGGDDDKKRRKKADMLTQAIGNLTFIFDPEQAKYMLKTPFAGMSYANDMLNLMTDLSTKNVKAVTPYAKLVDVGEMFED